MVKLAFVLAMSAIACNGDKPTPQQTTAAASSVSSAVPSETASAPPPRPRHACPTRVRGAIVNATDVDGGVMISVTGSDAVTIGEIQTRASTLGTAPPDGRRGRFCPEMEEGTTRAVTSTAKGVEITLVPTNASDLAHVRTDVRDHIAHSEKRPD